VSIELPEEAVLESESDRGDEDEDVGEESSLNSPHQTKEKPSCFGGRKGTKTTKNLSHQDLGVFFHVYKFDRRRHLLQQREQNLQEVSMHQ